VLGFISALRVKISLCSCCLNFAYLPSNFSVVGLNALRFFFNELVLCSGFNPERFLLAGRLNFSGTLISYGRKFSLCVVGR